MPNIFETTDAAAGTGTIYTLAVGQTAQGQLATAADHDWFAVTLTAGQAYSFALTGTGVNNVEDPFLRLLAGNGVTVLAQNDNGLEGNNSLIKFTAATSGTYYLDAGSLNDSFAGQYGVSITTGNRALFDIDMAAGVIDTDQSWGATPGTAATVTWGFRQSPAGYTVPGSNIATFTQLTAQEIAATLAILTLFSDVAGITFNQVNPGGFTDNAAILLANYSDDTDGSSGFAFFPGSTVNTEQDGDVWLNLGAGGISSTTLPQGSFSYGTIMHEIGHAIGLSHPGLYNAGPGVNPTYAADAQYAQDTNQFTIMSYFDESNTGGGDYNTDPDTPMLADVLALQRIYGANMATRNGNTIYGFGSNAGATYNFAINTTPALCIWDGGGTDTLNASGFAQTQTINLAAASFSSLGGIANNISIAVGAVIENATGGSGGDTITGNAAANTLRGGGGGDTMNGGSGDDTIYLDADGVSDTAAGDAGIADVLDLYYTTSATMVNFGATAFAGTASGGGLGSDSFTGIERVYGSTLADTVNGGSGGEYLFMRAGNDVINAGGGSDTLYGDADNDTLRGGTGIDYMHGGSGDDQIYLDADAVNDTVIGDLGAADIVDLFYATSAATVTFGTTAFAGTASGGGLGTDSFTGIERIYGSTFIDTVNGGSGAEYFYTRAGADVVNAGGGGDTVYGDLGNDVLRDGSGSDYMQGGAGDDQIYVDADGVSDTVVGDTGAADALDLFYATSATTVTFGATAFAGAASGGGQGTTTFTGIERIYGATFTDTATGGAGAEYFYLRGGADTVNAGGGNDIVYGEAGDDLIEGGANSDSLNGGLGLDTFDFNLGSGTDTMYDFTNDQDTLRIDPGYGFATAAAVVAVTTAVGNNALITLGGGNTITLVGYLAANTIASLGDDITIA